MHVAAAQKKNVALLAACQALLFTNNSTLIALNGLAGYALAPEKSLATAPVTGWVIGAAATTKGANDLCILLTMATSSLASGMILERNGWQTLNYAAIPFVLAMGVAVLWLMTKRRGAVAAA